MPTTRSRALRSNNTSAPESTIAVQPIVPPPPDRQKRKHSRVETENVPSRVPDDKNDAIVSAATAAPAKKRKVNARKSQGKPIAKMLSVPLAPQPVTVRVVIPTPPEVSQKAMRSAGSVIAKFDPWKMRDSTPNDSNGYGLIDSGEPIDNAIAYDENASTRSALQTDEQTAEPEVLSKDDLATGHPICGTEAAAGIENRATDGTTDVSFEESDIQAALPGGVPHTLVEGEELGSVEDDNGDADFSVSDNDEPARPSIIENGTNGQHKSSTTTSQGAEDNLDSEPSAFQQERDPGAEVDLILCAALPAARIEGAPEIGTISDDSSPDAGLSATFQESTFPGPIISKTNEDSDAASSEHSDDAEGVVDEEYWDSLQIENSLGSVPNDGEDYHAADKVEDRADLLEESGSITEPEVEGEVENPDRYGVFLETPAAKHQKLATRYLPDGRLEAPTPSEDDAPPNHTNANGTYDEDAPHSDMDERMDERSSDSDNDGDNMPLSTELDYLSDSSRCGHSSLDEQAYDDKSPGENDCPAEEDERSNRGSDDDLSDFLTNDDNIEQSSPERDEGELKNNSPEIMPEPVTGETSQHIEEIEGRNEDQLSSSFGSSRNTLEREELDDRAIWERSGAIALLTGEEEFEDNVGVEHRYTTGTDCSGTSKMGSEGDHELAEGDSQRIGQTAPEFGRAVENALWRQANAFETVQPSGSEIAENSSSLLSEVPTSLGLPPGVRGVFGALQNYQAVEATETNVLLKGIHETLTQQLEIQKREAVENARFRRLVTSRLDGTELE